MLKAAPKPTAIKKPEIKKVIVKPEPIEQKKLSPNLATKARTKEKNKKLPDKGQKPSSKRKKTAHPPGTSRLI